ncbi:MAG: PhzF family phenazine biosynthesis protein [Acidimicrobiia bacterium]|nr:PhzF family phenazine biosynthesis protein [Acidimicrobiia bacterium]MYC45247.1 PhzF family phenazine biosynthesis protein [Acidimicrobiia bacterium]MYI18870.1 PhzF family phenazine biosynthesis protein [Acidimicrobiia bacterium]
MRRTLSRAFAEVDVFTSVPYMGNPLAVVADAGGLTTDEMQRFASWTNLSETTFLLEPTAEDGDYRVRIFTPDRELPFAGHPTLGTCKVWLDQGGVPRRPGVIVQECGAGLVTIRSSHPPGDSPGNSPGSGPGDSPSNSSGSSRLAFAAPPLTRSGPVSAEDLAAACAILGIDPDGPDTPVVDSNWVENGPPWMAVLLRSADEVLALSPDTSAAANPRGLFIGVAGPHRPDSAPDPANTDDPAGPADPASPASPADFEVRAFFPLRGALAEDPVTGSLNASLGQWLTAAGHATAPYTASQGAALGRDGRVYIDQDPDGTIWVGGEVVTCIQGTVDL